MNKVAKYVLKTLAIIVTFYLSDLHAASIIATVNNKAISKRDLDHRVKLAIISTNMPDNAKTRKELQGQVLETMISEQVQIQLGESYDMKIDDSTIESAIRGIENQSNLPAGGLKKMLSSNGIPFSVMRRHLEASIIWREYIRERYRHLTQVGGDEVEKEMQELKASNGENRYHLSEIVIYFNDKEPNATTGERARKIHNQIKNGAVFSMLANQFSHAPSASRGGDIGVIAESQLENFAADSIKSLRSGQTTSLVQSNRGIHIYYLKEKLSPGEVGKPQHVMSFKQVFLPDPKDALQYEIEENLQRAAVMAGQVNSCRKVEIVTKSKGAKVRHVENIPVENLPGQLANLIKGLTIGKGSKPVYTGDGALFFVVCDRKTINPKQPTQEEVRELLVDQKLQKASTQEMRAQRGGAHVDIRVKL